MVVKLEFISQKTMKKEDFKAFESNLRLKMRNNQK